MIRSTAPRDDYLKAAKKYDTWSAFPDISHVQEKYGRAKYCEPWLLNRLGQSITRRRQFLKYRVEHHEKMTRLPEENIDMLIDKHVASTKATTFVEREDHQTSQTANTIVPSFAESTGSVTSYEQTIYEADGKPKHLKVPDPPEEAFPGVPFVYGEAFQCPYCFTEQVVGHKAAWK